jgi:hypothetical protein
MGRRPISGGYVPLPPSDDVNTPVERVEWRAGRHRAGPAWGCLGFLVAVVAFWVGVFLLVAVIR